MNIPSYEKLLLLTLRQYADQKEHQLKMVADAIADQLRLSDEQRAERTSSGSPVFTSRISWAHTYLKRAGLLESVRKGISILTVRGEQLLAEGRTELTNKDLMRYPEFVEFKNGTKTSTSGRVDSMLQTEMRAADLTPEEQLDQAIVQHERALQEELLDILRVLDPVYFEQVILDLLEAMGYGTGKTTKITGDGGIDGIINEDALGLSQIYMQAKRYAVSNVVNGKEVRDFYGALAINQVAKGVFITTSSFNTSATEAMPPHMKVVFIDGNRLANLLIQHNIGVTPQKQYITKSIDSDYYQA